MAAVAASTSRSSSGSRSSAALAPSAPSSSSKRDEVFVHRFRCGDWVPSAIRSLAVDDMFTSRVAIGREDGSIEIVNPNYKWFTNIRVPGKQDFKLQKVVWSNHAEEKGRLFGISLRGFAFEVDVANAGIINVRDVYGGSAWCLAASPRAPVLAVGCEDGTVRLFDYSSGRLEYARTLPTVGVRVLSVAYHPTQPKIFLGCGDGTIRCLDDVNGRSIYRMAGDFGKGLQTYVWSLLVLKDSTVVSGDNRGHVQFWDGDTGVLIVKFNQHTAEVLALTASPDETQIFASGTDNSVACIQKLNASDKVQYAFDNIWAYNSSHRPHSHEILALAVVSLSQGQNSEVLVKQPQGPLKSGVIMISGGVDCKLCVYSVPEFAKTRPTFVLPVPAHGLMDSSDRLPGSKARCLLAAKNANIVDLWSLSMHARSGAAEAVNEPVSTKKSKKGSKKGTADAVIDDHVESAEGLMPCGDGCNLELRIESASDEHVHEVCLSNNGCLLAVSRQSGLTIYNVSNVGKDISADSKLITKIPVPEEIEGSFVQSMVFNAESSSLALCSNGYIVIIDFTDSVSASYRCTITHRMNVRTYMTQLEQSLSLSKMPSDFSLGLHNAVAGMSFSMDCSYLSVTDCLRSVYVYSLDTMRLTWQLPESAAGADIVSAVFNPHSFAHNSELCVVYANNTFVLFDVEKLAMHPWSVANTDRLFRLTDQYAGPFESVTFGAKRDLYLHGQGFIVRVDLNKDIDDSEVDGKVNRITSGKIKHEPSQRSEVENVPVNGDTDISFNTFVASVGADPITSTQPQKLKRKRQQTPSEDDPKISKCLSIVELYKSIVFCKSQADNSLVSNSVPI
jgi:U3 small nucleolar RNA-associated protein 4